MSAMAKKGMAMIRSTVILLARVMVRFPMKELCEGGRVGTDPEPDSSISCFLSNNFGVFMYERQARSVTVGHKNIFFDPLSRKRRFHGFQKFADPFARPCRNETASAPLDPPFLRRRKTVHFIICREHRQTVHMELF